MDTRSEERRERRSGTRTMARNLVAERQEMLVSFCRLAGLEPYTPDKPVRQQLDQFCQLLMDYAAFGHFELYRRIADGSERRSDVVQVAEEVYSEIVDATDAAVSFNDRYDASAHDLSLETLPGDLSVLGEQLANRLELEDRLLDALLGGLDRSSDD